MNKKKTKNGFKSIKIVKEEGGFTKYRCRHCDWEYGVRFYTIFDFDNSQISCVNPECQELIYKRSIEIQLWDDLPDD